MSEKILTISIAAYNVEQYLAQALDSCVQPELLDDLEVLVVSDGATDRTPEIAREYEAKYPGTVRLIDKENGGYGTTVNRSMKEATGKYFKLLDGDDWFERDGLLALVETLKKTDADWVLSRLIKCPEGGEPTCGEPAWFHLAGTKQEMKDIDFKLIVGHWQTTVKTSILREHPFELPAHTLYTDQLFIFYTMPYVKTVEFVGAGVYCYRLGRDGQSVTKENRIKHYKEAVDNVKRMIDFYQSCDGITEENRQVVMYRLERFYRLAVKTLLLPDPNKEVKRELIALEKYAKKGAPDVYKYVATLEKKQYWSLRGTGYLAYGYWARKDIPNWE